MDYNQHDRDSTTKLDYDQTLKLVKIERESEASDNEYSTNTLENVESDEPLFHSLIADVKNECSIGYGMDYSSTMAPQIKDFTDQPCVKDECDVKDEKLEDGTDVME